MSRRRGTGRRRALRLLLLMPLLAVAGCWSSQDIQNQAYVTAIGLDYENGTFVVYAQVLNFANVAMAETTELGKGIPVWVGHVSAPTVSDALGSLHKTSQMPLYWGHTKVLVITERFMKQRGIRDAIQVMNRYREVRYNIYMYGTREKLADIFVQKSIFNLSPLDTVMFSPKQIYQPITGNRFIAKLDEPGNPAVLPSIGFDRKSWDEDRKSKSMFRINGGFYFTNKTMTSWMSEEDLKGATWAQPSLRDTVIKVPASPPYSAGIMATKARLTAVALLKNGEPKFRVEILVKGFVLEMFENVSVQRLQQLAADVVREQVRTTFLKGVARRCDPLSLQQAFYRKYPRRWAELGGAKDYLLRPESIEEIDVHVKLTHMGKYKGRTE